MATNFWRKLKKPIFSLAPMANVTDVAFRRIIAKYGKPDIFWTEFVSCDGLQSPGRNNLMIDLKYDSSEHPIVAQIFGSKPDNYYKTALLCQELGFDGIDINMGCPDRNVEKQGAGACHIKNPKLAQEIIIRQADFYEKGIKIKFEKNPDFKITSKEKSTIEKLIDRLEKNAKEIKDLKYTINRINTLSKDREVHSKYKIIKRISQAS